jgi:hypothetical protein
MKDLLKKIRMNYRQAQKLEQDSRNLIAQVVMGTEPMEDELFWENCTKLRKEIDRTTFGTKSGIHNFICYNFTEDILGLAAFIHAYNNKVNKIACNDELWENASKFEYFSNDGWSDFTDFLPLQGKEAYEHVLNDRREHKVYKDHHEAYIQMHLDSKFMLFADEDRVK